jgi:hypothetical protein
MNEIADFKIVRLSRDRECLTCKGLVLKGEPGTIVICGNYTRAIHQHCIKRYLERKKQRDEERALAGGKAGRASNGLVVRKEIDEE